jgi:hypothetical protein
MENGFEDDMGRENLILFVKEIDFFDGKGLF